ncbi:MAG: sulfurtransferase [Gammaproteobacteria bacterium]|nr:sulfurtransferase [Gammaproteobacteria bacterium]NNC97534.1 sulfurtransferase [Gammaproteobacteria bacterium]NNM14250.1 sulfurtransferase [Gammaproteobacteria bacterium]
MHDPVPQLAVQECATRLQSEPENTLLLDVREPWELDLAAVNGSINIPMHLVPVRLQELPQDKTIIVMCHHGGRSQQVAQYLTHHGYARVFNLSGGIHAWSEQVEPEIPQY